MGPRAAWFYEDQPSPPPKQQPIQYLANDVEHTTTPCTTGKGT